MLEKILMALQPYLSMLWIHDRSAELTSAPVKRGRVGAEKWTAADYVLHSIGPVMAIGS
jgi:hypothetical protein